MCHMYILLIPTSVQLFAELSLLCPNYVAVETCEIVDSPKYVSSQPPNKSQR